RLKLSVLTFFLFMVRSFGEFRRLRAAGPVGPDRRCLSPARGPGRQLRFRRAGRRVVRIATLKGVSAGGAGRGDEIDLRTREARLRRVAALGRASAWGTSGGRYADQPGRTAQCEPQTWRCVVL